MTDDKRPETVDEKDLYEDLTEEEMYELLQEKKKELKDKPKQPKPKRPFPKWVFWLIALFMTINIISVAPGFISLPAIEFLKTSAKLLVDDDVKEYKESVVLIDTGTSRGTGFSISPDGYIITNEHVVDGGQHLWIYYPEIGGPYEAVIEEEYPEYDLALLKIEGDNLPYLPLANEATFEYHEHFYFIGNPLNFSGIANEGKIIDWSYQSSLLTPVLMLDAPIYKGNSGSPVINEHGEVIAVIYATREVPEYGRIGLAIPIEAFHEHTDYNFLYDR